MTPLAAASTGRPADSLSKEYHIKLHRAFTHIIIAVFALAVGVTAVHAQDPLPSWNDGAAKKNTVEFVGKVTTEGSPDFVPVAERIAAFDNDGTLWAEQPMYFQLIFALDRVKALAPQHPEWKDKEPFASLLKGDVKSALAQKSPRPLIILSYFCHRSAYSQRPDPPNTLYPVNPVLES